MADVHSHIRESAESEQGAIGAVVGFHITPNIKWEIDMGITITNIIGTDNISIGSDEIADVDTYRDELRAALVEAFPDVAHIDVVIDNGRSEVRVAGIDNDNDGSLEDSMIKRVKTIANDIWNNGQWHDASKQA